MNSNKLLSVLRDTRLLKFVSGDELQKLADDHPYFQQAHILLAKKYLMDNNQRFEDKLHLAAIYASDRAHLRNVMQSDVATKQTASILIDNPVEVKAALLDEHISVNEDELSQASMSDTLSQTSLLEESDEVMVEENTNSEAEALEELEVASLPTDEQKEDELGYASLSDATLPQPDLTEEENFEPVAEDMVIGESTAIEELEEVASGEIVDEDELIHASMSDVLPPQDTLLDEENFDVMAEENASTEAEALEELEVAATPGDAQNETELSYTTLGDAMAPQNNLLEEENYEMVELEETTEAIAIEELEIAGSTEAHISGTTKEAFNVDQPHTFSDWLKYIQNSPRAIQRNSSAPDYQPISVPESTQTAVEEIAFVEHNPDILVAEPADNLQAIDEFIAEKTPNKEIAKVIPVKLLVDKSVEEDEELYTETLAHIYEEQQLYNKAIRVYAKLSLKFPEKSIYFATLIKELKSKV